MKTMVLEVSSQSARRLYYQGHKVCTSQDGYTTQSIVQQITNPVGEEFFRQNCLFGFVVPEAEALEIRKFQKQGLINMTLAAVTGIVCMNCLMLYQFFNNLWFLGGFLAISYFSVHYWLKVFTAIRPQNNIYLQVLNKYGLPLGDEE